MEKPVHTVGDRVEKFCAVCGESRGHVVATVTKRGQISRVNCPQCGTRSTFKSGGEGAAKSASSGAKTGAPYDWARTYRIGQTLVHPAYGYGEVTAVIEPKKIDVLFADRMRRLVHSRAA
jgi:hypothetical protein